jgi:uncharacterized membrane protein (DUF485 family)
MPEWLRPFLLPMLVVLAIILAVTLGWIGAVVLFVGAVVIRVLYVKRHPPAPELVHKPWWRF